MSNNTEELAKVQQNLTYIRSALKTASEQAQSAYGFWRSPSNIAKDLADSISDVANHVGNLAMNVDILCQIVQRIEASRPD